MIEDGTHTMGFIGPDGSAVRITEPTGESIRAFAEAYARRPQFLGWPSRAMDGDDTILDATDSVVQMYVNEGRWVGACPFCNGGVTGVMGAETTICLDCGRELSVEFPSAADVAEAERVLMQRDKLNMHWRPDRGETVETLKIENLERGVRLG